jgi:hypothetical protein
MIRTFVLEFLTRRFGVTPRTLSREMPGTEPMSGYASSMIVGPQTLSLSWLI